MVFYILAIAILNLVCGFALAVALERWQIAQPLGVATDVEPTVVDRRKSEQPIATQVAAPVKEEMAINLSFEEIPAAWQATLQEAAVQPASPVEAAIYVLKLENGRYSKGLTDVEDRARDISISMNAASLNALIAELEGLNGHWRQQQLDAKIYLADQQYIVGDADEYGRILNGVLTDQAAQIESASDRVSSLDLDGDLFGSGQELITMISLLVSHAHAMRDQLDDILANTLCGIDRLDSAEKSIHLDRLSGLPNRVGLEAVFQGWWRNDPSRHRLVCVALVDVDNFQALNERWGTSFADQIIGALGRQLNEFKEGVRELDHVARPAGQSFALFFGDTGLRKATTTIELIRQTIEATTFDLGANEQQLTIRGAVTEIGKEDSAPKVLERLRNGIREGKNAGGNRSFVCKVDDTTSVERAKLEVEPRVVSVLDEPTVASPA